MKYFVLKPFSWPAGWFEPRAQSLPLRECVNARLAQDAVTTQNVPSYDLALRDGWAVDSSQPAVQRVAAECAVKNGEVPAPLQPHEAVWINTGGMLPAGADAVICARSYRDASGLHDAVACGDNVLRTGQDWLPGQIVVPAGTQLGAAELAVLKEARFSSVKVYPVPSVSLIATGSEITGGAAPGSQPLRVSSDSFYIECLLAGMLHTTSREVRDDVAEIAAAMREAAQNSTCIVSVGGTGRGASDLTRQAIVTAGGTLTEQKDLSDGAPPFIAGVLNGVPIVGLPGNPLGAMVITQRVLLPRLLAGFLRRPYRAPKIEAEIALDVPETVTGELCVRLQEDWGAVRAYPMEKGTGRSRLFMDKLGVVVLQGQSLRRGDIVTVEVFAN